MHNSKKNCNFAHIFHFEMEKIEFTSDEEQMIEREFEALLDDYAHTLHRQRIDLIRRAFEFANKAHYGVRRLSGEPYIMHPLAVAHIVVKEIGLGSTSICAALLHDVVEDTEYTTEDIRTLFGDKIATIVDGLTKISGGVFGDKASEQAENFRKLLLTMSDDIRVVLIKIADRLHNMRTLGAQPKAKQYKIAGETLYIYAPLAHRLGLFPIKSELEDLSFRYEHPEEYAAIQQKITENKDAKMETFEAFAKPIRKKLSNMGYEYTLTARIKSVYSIWNKMQEKHVSFEDIYDLLAVRIVFTPLDSFSEKDQCWMIYSAITEIYRPHPERIRDWISTPKSNGYEALHVTVMGLDGEWIEVQIRTDRMHEIAERGLAAHWKYKAGAGSDEGELDKWLRDIKEILAHPEPNAMDFLGTFKLNLFQQEVFVFTPTGEIKTMPQGATALDLAYELHTELGEHCIGAKVNHNLVPLSYVLQSGDQVELLQSSSQHPAKEWLEWVVTAKAQAGLKTYLKREQREHAKLGEQRWEEAMETFHITIDSEAAIQRYLNHYDLNNPSELYRQIGTGAITLQNMPDIVMPKKSLWARFNPFNTDSDKTTASLTDSARKQDGIKGGKLPKGYKIILTDENLEEHTLCNCCHPIPGDEIMGYIDEEGNRFIHKIDCHEAQLLKSSKGRQICAAEWNTHRQHSFRESIEIKGIDRFGVLIRVLTILTEQFHINIHAINGQAEDGIFNTRLEVLVHDVQEINDILIAIKKIPEIKEVLRVKV